ncbi:MAG: hypothetical protein P9M06_06005 [Candidatus Saelkia tenebricola]|nr:hypothetical protein [Candidatus Saelkia tenebricola]
MKKSFLKSNQSFITIIVLVVVGLIFGLVFFGNLFKGGKNQMRELDQKINIANGEMKRKKMMMQEVNSFKKEQLEIESKTLKFSDAIPHSVDTTEFVKLLQGFSDQFSSEYRLKEIRVDIIPLEAIDDGGFYRRQFRIYCQGKYQDMIKFYGILQKAKYLLNMEELELKRNPAIVPLVETDFRISIIQSASEVE